MSAALQQRIASAAAQDLWRVAETDNVDELTRILPRVGDINARNQHGMTALMRASYHGHEQMVRALLEHDADPNLVRNDRFTALALAAFFGHTETVRILIEHGAKIEVVTRCGASAHMWATARTFSEVARCLETHAPAPASVRAPTPVYAPTPVSAPTPVRPNVPAPVAAPGPIAEPGPIEVKTLKDPPEIWDLVQEVPRNFDARSAFLSRLVSMNRGVAVGVLTGLLLIVGCGVGLWLLRAPQVSSVQPTVRSTNEAPTSNNGSASSNVETPAAESPAGTSDVQVIESPASAVTSRPRRVPRQFKPRSPEDEVIADSAPAPPEPAKAAAGATPQLEKPKSDDPSKRQPGERLSPQLVTPAQNQKPKAKVIQWP